MTVHILFGESAAGGLKWTLKKKGKNDKVIGFSDQFAVGPVFQLETEAGLVARVNWFKKHMPKDEFDFITIVNMKSSSEKLFVKLTKFPIMLKLPYGQRTMHLNRLVSGLC
ncbi:DUF1835 domain-containing protein [Fictibacillus sp. b24]|uniref:DUF1835 domain-containing protein n=1 Tax=Fictibacillus sp. b24 TaxID=3055863 RepID=UPI0025A18C7D|nr:DUF1835 domain-containing protein [Fictibacillus sp. b24]MDM5317091.1 DUF1835 domain-containing protein [Fictibacillus sp. b24]